MDGRTAIGETAWTVPARPQSVAELRARASAFAKEHGAAADLLGPIILAVSEAATNAVMHAFVDQEPGIVTLTCEAGPGELRYAIADDGRGMQPRTDSPGLGFGLSTMGKLATRMDVRASPAGVGTTVRLVFRAPGVRGGGRIAHDDPAGRLLVGASDLARRAAWPDEGFEQLCDLALPFAGDASSVDIVEDGTLRRLAAVVDGDPHLTARLRDSIPQLKPGTATWAALNGGGSQLVIHDPSVPRAPTGPGALLGLAWWLSVPLTAADGRVLAIWGVGGRGDRPPPDEATLALMGEAGIRAAGGLANAQILAEAQGTRRRLEGVLAALSEAVSVTDIDGRVAYVNPAAVRLFGAKDSNAVVGKLSASLLEAFHVTDEHGEALDVDQLPSRRLLSGEPAAPLVTRSVDRRTGRTQWLRTTARLLEEPDAGLVVNIVEDITESIRGERRSRSMLRVGDVLDRPDGIPAVLHAVAELLAPEIADACAIVRVHPDGRLHRITLAHPDPDQRARLMDLQERWPSTEHESTLAALRGDTLKVASRITDEQLRRMAIDDDHLAALRALGLRSMVTAPLRVAGRTVGLLTLVHDRRSVRTFDDADVAFIRDVGRRVATTIALAGDGC